MSVSAHLPVAMVALPMLTAIVCLLLGAASRGKDEDVLQRQRQRQRQRWIGGLSLLLLVGLSAVLLQQTADGRVFVYRLANWPSPFAIALVVDRLSAIMVSLTATLCLFVHLAAARGKDARGRFFHPLLQLQVMGLCGAFMTGDLFNLFVFFEILLIASYALLVFGDGTHRTRASLHYVALNLVGSALFLIAIGTLYGMLGTLNMADLVARAAQVSPADAPVVRAAGGLLLVVFGLKAAIVPMGLWLPPTYHAATTPVSALFAIMTKVGVYAIIRIFIPMFGPQQGAVAGVADPWILGLGLATLALGTLGALSATEFKRMVTFLVVASVGTQLTSVGLFTEQGLAAATFYIVHSTFLTAALFLLAGAIIHQRGELGGRLSAGPVMYQGRLLGLLFLVAALSAAGLPPLSGFVSKALILAATPAAWKAVVWTVVLVTSFLLLIQLSRVGSVLFWNLAGDDPPKGPRPGPNDSLVPAVVLLSFSVVLAAAAGPLDDFTRATATQLYDRDAMIERVMTDAQPPPKTRRGDPPPTPHGFARRPGQEAP
ncbi:MAG: monovalent cation/H+ antiporter subunit D [Myxococcota bacterium]